MTSNVRGYSYRLLERFLRTSTGRGFLSEVVHNPGGIAAAAAGTGNIVAHVGRGTKRKRTQDVVRAATKRRRYASQVGSRAYVTRFRKRGPKQPYRAYRQNRKAFKPRYRNSYYR